MHIIEVQCGIDRILAAETKERARVILSLASSPVNIVGTLQCPSGNSMYFIPLESWNLDMRLFLFVIFQLILGFVGKSNITLQFVKNKAINSYSDPSMPA